ncbi:MAG: DinG family ATP-dependent helicase YoaA [uncultured Friedmanniella sp.]|uniref:ATP-dependent helicase DinG n=1 Tax=uncultured Friedmanniella sp. TaxID=335381 RepID=A0A6J4M1T6_9ACTN|nr:MAG: DinG family ATP-dependent helicase YoaA [uncultured Friedmanniella sp.]
MTPAPTTTRPRATRAGHREVLVAAVDTIGGAERPGQVAMADAVDNALATGRHLLIQAGTGTGKSLGYLAPTLVRLAGSRERIVIATATLALQSQLADNDIPAALDAVQKVTGKRPKHAVLKGRTNYACLLRVRDGSETDQSTLISAADLAGTITPRASPESVLGAEVLALREWAEEEATSGGLADRDGAPSHTDRGWQQVSIPVRECLGAQRCPFGDECFVEKSREVARGADLVVTNHALLAINAMHGGTALPEHSAVIIDEAHELVARVTGAASAELTPAQIERVARRAMPHLDDDVALDLLESAETLRGALEGAPLERVEDTASAFVEGCATVRDAARSAVSAMTGGDDKADGERRQAAAAVKEVFDVAERMAALHSTDVIWVSESERMGRAARVAPLSVAGLMRSAVFGETTTVLTSATLKLGGEFTQMAGSVGLRPSERDDSAGEPENSVRDADGAAADEDAPVRWRGLDVGSPFDYGRQGILYLTRSMPAPGRDGMPAEVLTEIAELVWAAGGRTLGLFSSRRAAEAAAVHVRKQLPKQTVLCQGDAQLSELTRRFVAEEQTSLFGTLSLWQGIDVPGPTCSLVIIDRVPFPRPDEPLTLARQRAVAEAGGNGFMSVAATHAALLLAQGAGRLIRRTDDKGVVAVLDPRLATARYGGFLRASMPPMWQTSDRETVVQALRRLSGQA